MELCPLCEKIKKIRTKQGRNFFGDLCGKCKIVFLTQKVHRKSS